MSDERVQEKASEDSITANTMTSSPVVIPAEAKENDDSSRRLLQQGSVVTGTVMRVELERVFVDVGAKSPGIIRLHELSRDSSTASANIVAVGEKISVYVLEPVDQEGNLILSKRRAEYEQAWERVQQAKESGETLMVVVEGRVRGGLVVNLVIRGFVPISHVGNGSGEITLDEYLGQTIPVKVIEVEKDRRKVVLSNKLAVEEEPVCFSKW